MPYYLLLVGGPDVIPYRFQYQLDVEYAVGRIHFDTVEEYANYAETIVHAEERADPVPRRAAFFGVRTPDDEATLLSCESLVGPLSERLEEIAPDWGANTFLADDATKDALGTLLGGGGTPAFLLTASHGLSFGEETPETQRRLQGALLCQDWDGHEELNPGHYFSADDVTDDAELQGLIAFHFACFGAGTPEMDDFAAQAFRKPKRLAPKPFVAGLPRRLLGHPNGGALAAVGHVDLAWGYSFSWDGLGPQLQTYESMLDRLLSGHPLGSAMQYFDQSYAALAAELSDELEQAKYGTPVDELELSSLWTASNDARNFVIVGDPAVRLHVG